MAIQTINIGNRVNDGLGDDLRTAFQKVNANFTELGTTLTITASNSGTTGEGVFKQKVNQNLEFRTITAGNKITVTGFTDSIVIANQQPDAFTTITTNSGTPVIANQSSGTIALTIQGKNGARNITTSNIGNVIEIDSVLDLNQILLSYDFGPVDGTFDHPIQLALATANIDFGTITNPGSLSLDVGSL